MAVVADFKMYPDTAIDGITITAGMPVRFEDTSVLDPGDSVSTWSWTFTGELPSSYENPIRSFKSSGSVTVQLTVNTVLGSNDVVNKVITVVDSTGYDRMMVKLDSDVGGTIPYLSTTIRFAGPVKAMNRLFVFTAPDDVSTTDQAMSAYDDVNLRPELYLPFPVTGQYLDVKRGRMAACSGLGPSFPLGERLYVSGDTDTIFFLDDPLGPVKVLVTVPGVKFKALATLNGDELWAIVENVSGGTLSLSRYDTINGTLIATPAPDIASLDPNPAHTYDPANLEILLPTRQDPQSPPQIFPSLVEFNTFALAPGSIYWSMSNPSTFITLIDPATGTVTTADDSENGVFLIHEAHRAVMWELGSFGEKAIGKRLDVAGDWNKVEQGSVFVQVSWIEYDGLQNVWFHGRDLFTSDGLQGEVFQLSGSQPCGMGFVACFNTLLREIVGVWWEDSFIADRASGPEVIT